MLHHAVLLKQKEIIKYLIKYDSDNNFLKTNKDSKGKTPIDLDRTKTFENEYYTVWDAAKKNDVDLLKKLIKDLKYYEVNEQTYINKNTPLHMAVKYKGDRAILYLLKEGGDKDKKNINGHTPLDTIEKVQFPDRKWIKIAKRILDGEIKEFVQLDKLKIDKYMDSNNASKINHEKEKKKKLGEELRKDMRLLELLSMIKEQINKNKINIKELFDQLDKNKNGRLNLKEFKNLFTKLNIEEINEEDIIYILSHLDSNKDGKLQYKEFLNLLI
jgi:Ca2+-binding EF-hand superfamily protein